MKIQGIIFDMDGTLVDSEGDGFHYLEVVFGRLGVALTAREEEYIYGRSWDEAFEFIRSQYPSVTLSNQEIKDLYLDEKLGVSRPLKEFPGAAEAVRKLYLRYPLALVSGSYQREVDHVVHGLGIGQCFAMAMGIEGYGESKPSPRGFLAAAAHMGVDPGNVVVFEDSEPGIEAALRAGMTVVAVTCTQVVNPSHAKAHQRLADWRQLPWDLDAWI